MDDPVNTLDTFDGELQPARLRDAASGGNSSFRTARRAAEPHQHKLVAYLMAKLGDRAGELYQQIADDPRSEVLAAAASSVPIARFTYSTKAGPESRRDSQYKHYGTGIFCAQNRQPDAIYFWDA